ncbi:MAG TPA: tRNA 2-thiouridine(34) synthase MnmA [Thermoanaerobaculales bacterium]|nr:tRNA 2-thiouridine(34) synthase MnmA [Thermoanaerobaculales bacterium]HQL29084.1 tRNA 2-thiouridine(34) synthase MnmA [Thermoanaerobaculales bacterium]HQN96496.1 tRNA 2-thiouridine(34) synthase MnmA [Thermoanaerobaculales bacterium]
MSRIVVLASGGVDSSVALLLLAEEGRHSLEACYLKIWLSDEMAFLGRCPWEEDLAHVRAVCERLGVPLRVLPLQREYFATVVEYTIAELRAGRTPSPDVVCNRAIKFGAVIDRLGDEFELVASGHHARVGQRGGLARLLRGADPVKDQSYFLCQLSQRQLARCVFPIGGMTKAEVRAAARRAGLANQDRPDSQGICFLGRVPYDDFVEFSLGTREGDILEHGTGRVLGRHRGYWFHTIGQRRGLGLAGGPWYVVAKDPERNLVTVVHAGRLAEHRRTRFRIAAPVWIAAPPARTRLEVRIRHGERLLPCTAEVAADGSVEVTLDDGDAGIAAGQFAALYDGEECLGGGPVAAEV